MSKTPNNANYIERLHALDLATGQDLLAPVTIQASYPGSGPGNDGKGIFQSLQKFYTRPIGRPSRNEGAV